MNNRQRDGLGSSRGVGLPSELITFIGVALLLTVVALLIEAYCRWVLHMQPPYRSPLLSESFPDLVYMRPRFRYFHTLKFFSDSVDPWSMYPAPIAVCYRFFYMFQPHDIGVFLGFTLSSFAVAAALVARGLVRQGLKAKTSIAFVIIAFFTSFPIWFDLRQANMEICPWVVLAVGMWCYFRNRGYSAAACFGIAGALKITPFLYFTLFLSQKRFRHVLVGMCAAIMTTLPSLWAVFPNVPYSWRMTNLMIAKFRTVVTLRSYPPIAFDHSIFGLLKRAFIRLMTPEHLSTLLTVYSVASALVLVTVYAGWVRKLPPINQILCLCIATLIVPPTSFDYTLLNLYFPFVLLALLAVRYAFAGSKLNGLNRAMLCFAVVFVPETEFILRGHSFGGQIKALTLIILFWISVRNPFPWRLETIADEVAEPVFQ